MKGLKNLVAIGPGRCDFTKREHFLSLNYLINTVIEGGERSIWEQTQIMREYNIKISSLVFKASTYQISFMGSTK